MKTLHKYSPVNHEGMLYLPRDHGIKSLGFKQIKTGSYMYAIESPLLDFSHRRYFFEFSEPEHFDFENLVPDFFSGLIGEGIMRIVVTEFMRRRVAQLEIDSFDFLKEKNGDEVLRRNGFVLQHRNKYNIEFLKYGELQAEFDGLVTYTQGRLEGVLLCEAKTGAIGKYRNPIANYEEIMRKLVKPLHALYPDAEKKFLLMANQDALIDKDRRLQDGLVELTRMLEENDIGFIPFSFPNSKEEIDKIGRRICNLNKRLRKDKKAVHRKMPHPEYQAIMRNGAIYIIKKGRIEKILEQIGDRKYQELF